MNKIPYKDVFFEYTVWIPDTRIPGGVPICGLCGNSGIISTRGTAFHLKKPCGVDAFCICPNGRALKKERYRKKWGGSSIVATDRGVLLAQKVDPLVCDICGKPATTITGGGAKCKKCLNPRKKQS